MTISAPTVEALWEAASSGDAIKRERRSLVWRDSLEDQAAVFKLYRHRGWVNTGRGALIQHRTEREFKALSRLVEDEVACTEPLGWWRGHSKEHSFWELLVTREIAGAENLETLLSGGGFGRDGWGLENAFQLVRQMHDAGVAHGALYARNLLAGPTLNDFWICDLAKALRYPQSIVGSHTARFEILDLCQSLVELGITVEQFPLDAYGIARKAQDELRRVIAGYRQSKLRNRRRNLVMRTKVLRDSFAAGQPREALQAIG